MSRRDVWNGHDWEEARWYDSKPLKIRVAIFLAGCFLLTSASLWEDFRLAKSADNQFGPHWQKLEGLNDWYSYYDYDGHKLGSVYKDGGEWTAEEFCDTMRDYKDTFDTYDNGKQYVERKCATAEFTEAK